MHNRWIPFPGSGFHFEYAIDPAAFENTAMLPPSIRGDLRSSMDLP